MKDSSTGEGPRVTLNRENLDRLRRAHGIDTDADLARKIGIDPITLWRVTNGKSVPSNQFIARVLTAFPHTQFGTLFDVGPVAQAA